MFKRFLSFLTVAVIASVIITGCSALKQLQDTITNLSRLKFKLENINHFSLAGVQLDNKQKISDFSISDALKLTNAFATKQFPANFTINLGAMNPNDGTSGTKATNATLTGLEYRILIDDTPTVTGDLAAPVTVPGTGQSVTIPLSAGVDLYKFFGDRGYDGIINLALAIGGQKGSASKIKLDAKPTVSTSIGPISYPGRLTIVDKEWRN